MLKLGWTQHRLKKGDYCLIHVPPPHDPANRDALSTFPSSLEGMWRGLVVETGPGHELGRRCVHYQIAAVLDDIALDLREDGQVWQGREPDRYYAVWPSTLLNEVELEATRTLERLDRRVLAAVARARERVSRLRTKTNDFLSSFLLF